jgi:hypothetical protein
MYVSAGKSGKAAEPGICPVINIQPFITIKLELTNTRYLTFSMFIPYYIYIINININYINLLIEAGKK